MYHSLCNVGGHTCVEWPVICQGREAYNLNKTAKVKMTPEKTLESNKIIAETQGLTSTEELKSKSGQTLNSRSNSSILSPLLSRL